MTKRWIAIVACFCTFTLGVWTARAGSHATPRWANASIRCNVPLTEDTAAHIHEVDYWHHADGSLTLIYRCDHGGY